jgi:hypothetical protein
VRFLAQHVGIVARHFPHQGVGKNIADAATQQAARAKFNPRLHSPWPGCIGRQAAQKESPP